MAAREVDAIAIGCPVEGMTLGLDTTSEGGFGGGNGGIGSPSVGATTFGLRNCSADAVTPPTRNKNKQVLKKKGRGLGGGGEIKKVKLISSDEQLSAIFDVS